MDDFYDLGISLEDILDGLNPNFLRDCERMDMYPSGMVVEEIESIEGAFKTDSVDSELEKENDPTLCVLAEWSDDFGTTSPLMPKLLPQCAPAHREPDEHASSSFGKKSDPLYHPPNCSDVPLDPRYFQTTEGSGPLELIVLSPTRSISSRSKVKPRKTSSILFCPKIKPKQTRLSSVEIRPMSAKQKRQKVLADDRRNSASYVHRKKEKLKGLVAYGNTLEKELNQLKMFNHTIKATLRIDRAQLKFLENEIRREISPDREKLSILKKAVKDLNEKRTNIVAQQGSSKVKKTTVASQKSRNKRRLLTAENELRVYELEFQIQQEEKIRIDLESVRDEESRNSNEPVVPRNQRRSAIGPVITNF